MKKIAFLEKINISEEEKVINYNYNEDVYLPYNKIYKRIIIAGYTTIPQQLMQALSNQYAHGAEIYFNALNKAYKIKKAAPLYNYKFIPYELNNAVPKSLANFEFKFKGENTTYLNALKTIKGNYLPKELWNALDIYSQKRIEHCKELNKNINYEGLEKWYKEVMKDCIKNKIKMYSPNEKTFYEANAEIKFERAFPKEMSTLTPEQEMFLEKYAPLYGVEIPKVHYSIQSRKTKHGWTEEICMETAPMGMADWENIRFNANKDTYEPSFVRHNKIIQSQENNALRKQAYDTLIYLIETFGDEMLDVHYKRCPRCGEIHHENRDCECGYEEGITILPGDDIFNGNYVSVEERIQLI